MNIQESAFLDDSADWGAKMAIHYDKRVRERFPIYDELLDQAIGWIQSKLKDDASIMTLGAGTGEEITRMAKARPHWRFDGYDTSPNMLQMANAKFSDHGLSERVTLHLGSVDKLDSKQFDGATSLLVLHFFEDNEDGKLFALKQIRSHVSPGAPLVLADVLGCLDEPDFESQYQQMKQIVMNQVEDKNHWEKHYDAIREMVKWATPERLLELASSAGWKLEKELFSWHCLHLYGFIAGE